MTLSWSESQLESVPCEVCGASSGTAWVVRPDGLTVVRCNCGFAYLSPRPKVEEVRLLYQRGYYSSEEGIGYADYRSGTMRNFIKGVARKNLLFLRSQGWQPKGRLLEIGCALGDFCVEAHRAGAEVLGLDLNVDGIQGAREAHPHLSFKIGTAESLLAEEGADSFDAVCAYEVIEHCLSARSFLHSAAILLRPGGFLALSTPNLAKALTLPKAMDWLGFTSSFEHLVFFDIAALRRIAEEVGFILLTAASVESHRVAKPRRPGFRLRDHLHPLGDWDTASKMKDFSPACQGHQLNAVFRKG